MKNFDLSRFGIGDADASGQTPQKKQKRGYDPGFVIMAALAAFTVIFLWLSPVGFILYPFRILTTIVHELSHALATIVTGGQVLGIQINPNGSGVTFVRGGWAVPVASAGYLGTTLFGGALLLLAKLKLPAKRFTLFALATTLVVSLLVWMIDYGKLFQHVGQNLFILFATILASGAVFFASFQKGVIGQPRKVLQFIGAALGIGGLLWTIDILYILSTSFAIGMVLVIAGGLGLIAYRGPNLAVTYFFYTLAIISNLNAFWDLLNVIAGTTSVNGHNDATILAAATGIPAVFWAGLWLVIGIAVMVQCFRVALRRGAGSPNYSPLTEMGISMGVSRVFGNRNKAKKPEAKTAAPAKVANETPKQTAKPSPKVAERKIRDDDPFGFRS